MEASGSGGTWLFLRVGATAAIRADKSGSCPQSCQTILNMLASSEGSVGRVDIFAVWVLIPPRRTLDPGERAPGIAEAPFWSPGNLATRIRSGRRSPGDSGTYFGLTST